jgi:serine/threonine-protein kinase
MDGPLSQGRVILGKYRIERVLGKGAMGIVLAARHIQLDDRVAIKLLLEEMMAEPGIQDRFLQEARAARKIKSEHVTHVTDVGLLETGTPYIIMEYLEGKDLAKIRGERGHLEVEEVVEYVLQACDAIAEAHSHGIVHRDLKPANLFLTRGSDGSPLVKVLDFGTSKMPPKETVAGGGLEMTQTGMAIGSPSYMAPEQMLSSRNLDGRADIWALGVILYNLLTGAFPFKAETLLQMCAAVIQSTPTPPSVYRANIPPGLEAAILRCLEKKPEDRFPDVSALARALLPFASAQARYLVERMERVLGVSSELATFLAPSLRNPAPPSAPPQLERVEIDVPISLLPPPFSSRPERRPEAAVVTKSLSASTLATVIRNEEPSVVKESGEQAAPKSGRKRLLVGASAALSIAAAVIFTLTSPFTNAPIAPAHGAQGGPGESGALTPAPATAVRPIEMAIPVRTASAAEQTPQEIAHPDATAGAVAVPGAAGAPGAAAAPTVTAPSPSAPSIAPTGPMSPPRPGYPNASPGAPFATAPAHAGAAAPSGGYSGASQPAAPPPAPVPPPAKPSTPSIQIPDDR